MIAVQTLNRPPFAALFEPTPQTAFVGITVEWTHGSVSTAMLPYRY